MEFNINLHSLPPPHRDEIWLLTGQNHKFTLALFQGVQGGTMGIS